MGDSYRARYKKRGRKKQAHTHNNNKLKKKYYQKYVSDHI